MLCALFGFSCQSEIDDKKIVMGVNCEQLSSLRLRGSKWKLAGLYHSEIDRLRVIEPDCRDCYTLTFATNTTAKGFPVHPTYSMEFTKEGLGWFVEQILIIGPTGLVKDWFIDVVSYSISNSEIRLYTRWDNNYLLYKRFGSFRTERERWKDVNHQTSFNLKGTKWKWQGIYNNTRNIFRESLVDYMLTFDTENTAKGFSGAIPFFDLVISEKFAEMTIQWENIIELSQPEDILFRRAAFAVASYSINETELKLYTYDKKYLLFKKLEQ